MFQNLFQLTCFLVLGVLLSGCSSKTAAPEKPDSEDPTAATLAAGLRNKRIHFEIKQGDSRETRGSRLATTHWWPGEEKTTIH